MEIDPNSSFSPLQSLLMGAALNPTANSDESPREDPIIGRIRQILKERNQGNTDGHADLTTLVRHALMMRGSTSQQERVRISKKDRWQKVDVLRSFGINVIDLGDDLLFDALPWQPTWLGPSVTPNKDVFADLFSGQTVRQSAETPIDPCVEEATGFTNYVCPGQREAVRSLLHMPVGSTLIVNLPTGSGKTLVGQVATLLGGMERGLTLFVVPTTALAIDQERRMRDFFHRTKSSEEMHKLAWFGELSVTDKALIKQKIRAGTQGILFASPEATNGPLRTVLHEAAAKGMFRYLVIDEAHMVAEWGDSFRPAFQVLAGVRSGLLRHCCGEPFRTVLMSATLTPQTLDTLETLFGPPSMVQMVAAVHLRPEPRYLSYRARDRHEKSECVRELLRHAPRPFILYVTEPHEAKEWYKILIQDGFRRIGCFHGETKADIRATIIQDWAGNRLDGIVATAAFGVGMDKSDIRTIIHATVPETLNRFYQEVGRGGRDGKASISVVIFTAEDESRARSLGTPKLIGYDNAFERWQTLFASHRLVEEEWITVDISVVPPRLHQQTGYNEAWNMRTLILMVRSGLIALDSAPPKNLPIQKQDEEDAAYEIRLDMFWEAFSKTITLRTLDAAHLNQEHFDGRISNNRERSLQSTRQAFDKLMAALNGTQEMAKVLANLYRSNLPNRTVIVSKSCRGCPNDPSDLLHPYQIPSGIGIERIAPVDISEWNKRFARLSGTVTVLYPPDATNLENRLYQALNSLVGVFNLSELSAPTAAWQKNAWMKSLHRVSKTKTLIARTIEEEIFQLTRLPVFGLPVPRVSLLWPWGNERIPDPVLLLDRPLHVILAPRNILGDHPLRLYVDTAPNTIDLDTFLMMATR